MGQARIRKQKGAYPTQIFELEPQESKRLAELLPPYIIGMKFDPAERHHKMQRNKKATTEHFSSSTWQFVVVGDVGRNWIHLSRSSQEMRQTLSAGSSQASVHDCSHHPSVPTWLQNRCIPWRRYVADVQ